MCDAGGVLKLISPTDIWAYAQFGFWPLPAPPIYVLLRATLSEHKNARDGAHWRLTLRSAGREFDRGSLPPSVRQHAEVPISAASITIAAATSRSGDGPRTSVSGQLVLDLSQLSGFGVVRHVRPPQWLVNGLTSVLLPRLWGMLLTTVASVQEQGAAGPFGTRITADPTGVYSIFRRRSGQRNFVAINRARASNSPMRSARHRRRWGWPWAWRFRLAPRRD